MKNSKQGQEVYASRLDGFLCANVAEWLYDHNEAVKLRAHTSADERERERTGVFFIDGNRPGSVERGCWVQQMQRRRSSMMSPCVREIFVELSLLRRCHWRGDCSLQFIRLSSV